MVGWRATPVSCRWCHGWIDPDIPRGSANMLPDGQMFGRICPSLKPLAV